MYTEMHHTLCLIDAAGPELRFPPIPSFSPELFAYMRCAPNQKKAFAKGVEGLLGEGAVQVTLLLCYVVAH
jgi:peptide subunit release factor RF-3